MVALLTSCVAHGQVADSAVLAPWDEDGGRACVATSGRAGAQHCEGSNLLRHNDGEYEAQLAGIQARLLEMAGKVQEMITSSMRALVERDDDLARRMIAFDDEIDRLEVATDELCLQVLAMRRAVASDLRFVTTVMKMVTDLERTADMAVHICERSLELGKESIGQPATELGAMATIVQAMLHAAMLAFVDKDASQARGVIEREQAVDLQSARLLDELLRFVRKEPRRTDDATRLQAVATYLERIGDHATNLAEMAVFRVEGKDIRHERAVDG